MQTITRLALAALLGLSLPAAVWAAGDPPEVAPARAAAENWLTLIDTGLYETSWKQAAALFNSSITAAQWATMAAQARGPLGKLVSRSFDAATFMTTAPGAPDGKYVRIQYKSVFQNKKDAVETVTPTLEKDGKWRVSGYFIK